MLQGGYYEAQADDVDLERKVIQCSCPKAADSTGRDHSFELPYDVLIVGVCLRPCLPFCTMASRSEQPKEGRRKIPGSMLDFLTLDIPMIGLPDDRIAYLGVHLRWGGRGETGRRRGPGGGEYPRRGGGGYRLRPTGLLRRSPFPLLDPRGAVSLLRSDLLPGEAARGGGGGGGACPYWCWGR